MYIHGTRASVCEPICQVYSRAIVTHQRERAVGVIIANYQIQKLEFCNGAIEKESEQEFRLIVVLYAVCSIRRVLYTPCACIYLALEELLEWRNREGGDSRLSRQFTKKLHYLFRRGVLQCVGAVIVKEFHCSKV